jgi:predicted unusual protein kinase regulating ubiquinone biosynthesis (AarF/ABC1/UbiB family)
VEGALLLGVQTGLCSTLSADRAHQRSEQAHRRHAQLSRYSQTVRWMDVLLEVHGFEVFQSPIFNADPHPGNITVMSDGRLGLIDYGQCKAISCEERLAIARFVLAVADESPVSELADALRNCGMRAC